jgi:hypothetical protein
LRSPGDDENLLSRVEAESCVLHLLFLNAEAQRRGDEGREGGLIFRAGSSAADSGVAAGAVFSFFCDWFRFALCSATNFSIALLIAGGDSYAPERWRGVVRIRGFGGVEPQSYGEVILREAAVGGKFI